MSRFRAAAQVAAFFLIGLGGSSLVYGGDDGDRLDVTAAVEMPALKREYTWQFTYRSDALDELTRQPGLQLDRYPGMNITLDDSWVVGLRFELDYGWAR